MRRGKGKFILLAFPSTPHSIINSPHNILFAVENSTSHPKVFEKLSHSITKTSDTSPYQPPFLKGRHNFYENYL